MAIAGLNTMCYPVAIVTKFAALVFTVLSFCFACRATPANANVCGDAVAGGLAFTGIVSPQPFAVSGPLIVSPRFPFPWEEGVVPSPINLLANRPALLSHLLMRRGRYVDHEFRAKWDLLRSHAVGRLYIQLLSHVGALLSPLKPGLSQEFFMLSVLNRPETHPVPLYHLAHSCNERLMRHLPSLAELHASHLRSRGPGDTDRTWLALIRERLETLERPLIGGRDPLEQLRATVSGSFEVLESDVLFDTSEDLDLFEYELKTRYDLETDPVEHGLLLRRHRRSRVWDDTPAPFVLVDAVLFDDIWETFSSQLALSVELYADRALVLTENNQPHPHAPFVISGGNPYEDEPDFPAALLWAVELDTRRADLIRDLIRQFRNYAQAAVNGGRIPSITP